MSDLSTGTRPNLLFTSLSPRITCPTVCVCGGGVMRSTQTAHSLGWGVEVVQKLSNNCFSNHHNASKHEKLLTNRWNPIPSRFGASKGAMAHNERTMANKRGRKKAARWQYTWNFRSEKQNKWEGPIKNITQGLSSNVILGWHLTPQWPESYFRSMRLSPPPNFTSLHTRLSTDRVGRDSSRFHL